MSFPDSAVEQKKYFYRFLVLQLLETVYSSMIWLCFVSCVHKRYSLSKNSTTLCLYYVYDGRCRPQDVRNVVNNEVFKIDCSVFISRWLSNCVLRTTSDEIKLKF